MIPPGAAHGTFHVHACLTRFAQHRTSCRSQADGPLARADLAACGQQTVRGTQKLVARGLALAATEQNGRRARTVYAITDQGRQALAAWLHEPGAGPVLEYEQLVKVFFADSGTKASTLASLRAARQWAQAQCAASLAVAGQYAQGQGPFPQRLPQIELTSRFLTDFYVLVLDWASWASAVVQTWPDDPRNARAEPEIAAETTRRASIGAHDRHDRRPLP